MIGRWNTPQAAGMPVSSCTAAPAARIFGARACSFIVLSPFVGGIAAFPPSMPRRLTKPAGWG